MLGLCWLSNGKSVQTVKSLCQFVVVMRDYAVFSVAVFNRFVVLESALGLESGLKSIFAGLGLETGGLGLGVGKICNQVHFQFSLCTSAVFCLGRMTFCQPYRTHNQSSMLFIGELRTAYSHLHCIDFFLLLVHTAIKDLDSESCNFSGLGFGHLKLVNWT